MRCGAVEKLIAMLVLPVIFFLGQLFSGNASVPRAHPAAILANVTGNNLPEVKAGLPAQKLHLGHNASSVSNLERTIDMNLPYEDGESAGFFGSPKFAGLPSFFFDAQAFDLIRRKSLLLRPSQSWWWVRLRSAKTKFFFPVAKEPRAAYYSSPIPP